MPLMKIMIRARAERIPNQSCCISQPQSQMLVPIPSCRSMAFIMNPAPSAQRDSVIRKTTSCFLPIILQSVVRVAALVAGPVIRKISAAPGDIPALIKANAIGTDPDEQTYKGMPMASMRNMAVTELPPRLSAK